LRLKVRGLVIKREGTSTLIICSILQEPLVLSLLQNVCLFVNKMPNVENLNISEEKVKKKVFIYG
jgi:hypothetical protein